MRILLISPANSDLIHSVSVPLGLVSIGTYLKNRGHNVKIVDLAISKISVSKVIKSFNPDICGVSVRSSKSVSLAYEVSKKIKKHGIPVVWGGPFCNQAPVEVFFDSGVIDIISFGEGEMTWIELAEAIEKNQSFDKIKGIAFKQNNNIIKTPDRDFMDLSKVIPCDWSMVDIKKYFQYLYGADKLLYLYMSKGCPGHCSFCYNVEFHHSCLRRKAMDVFIIELKELVENYGLNGFYLADEMAFSRKSDLYKLCDILDSLGYNLTWGFQTRIGALNKDDFKRAYDSGCRWIDFGIETGSPKMIERIGKKIPMDKIIPTFEWCEEIGIITLANFIVGMPGETIEDLKYTVDLAKKLPNNNPTFLLYAYNYGSPMGKEIYNCKKYKLPDSLLKYKLVDVHNNFMPNYSEIPEWDKRVVKGYFSWKQISEKDVSQNIKKYDLLYKHLKTFFKGVSYVGVRHFPEAFLKTFMPFVELFISAKFCKKTLKKYDIE